MTENSVNAFLLVAEKGSITEAARASYISPQALWKSISSMEAELQTKLFIRSGRTLELSPSGRVWQAYYTRSRTRIGQLVSRLQYEADSRTAETQIRLGIVDSIWSSSRLKHALSAYGAGHLRSDTALTIRLGSPLVISQLFDAQELDAALLPNDFAPAIACDQEILTTSEYCIALGGKHPLLGRGAPLEEYLRGPFLVYLSGDGTSFYETGDAFSNFFSRTFGLVPQTRIIHNQGTLLYELYLGDGQLLTAGYDRPMGRGNPLIHTGVRTDLTLLSARSLNSREFDDLRELLRAAYRDIPRRETA